MHLSSDNSSSVARYLDIWRGASYSTLLALLYQASLFDHAYSNTIPIPLGIFILFVTIFLILDGVTRHSTRQIIRSKTSENNPSITLLVELSWVTLELVGLLVFSFWAYQTMPVVSTLTSPLLIVVPRSAIILFSLFCLLNFFHNGSQIQADQGPKLAKWLLYSITRDALELESVPDRWAKHCLAKIETARSRYADAKKVIIEELQSVFGQTSLSTPIPKFIRLLLLKPTKANFLLASTVITRTSALGFVHFGLQYLQFHLLMFNIVPAIAFLFLPPSGAWQTWGPAASNIRFCWTPVFVIILLFALSVGCYLFSAYYEINRRSADPDSTKPAKAEARAQFLGNITLLCFLLCLEAYLPVGLLMVLVLLENILFSISIHIINMPPISKGKT